MFRPSILILAFVYRSFMADSGDSDLINQKLTSDVNIINNIYKK